MAEAIPIDQNQNRYPKYSQQRQADLQNARADADPEKKQRIKIWMGALLVVTALTIDLLEFLLEWLGIGLVLSPIISVGAAFLFWLWFKLLDVSFVGSPKKFATQAVTSLAEVIPGLDAIGGFIWTIGTLVMVIIVRAEDKGGIIGKAASVAEGGLKKAA